MGDRQIQRYALDAKGYVINVRNMPDKGARVFCPHCRDAMIPKTGKIRVWHFAHKVRPCAYNSYLHSLAEIRIAEWFNRSASIILDMEARGVCADRGNCAFFDPG